MWPWCALAALRRERDSLLKLLAFPAPIASLCAWGTPAAQLNSVIESAKGGTVGRESSLAPEMVLGVQSLGGPMPGPPKTEKPHSS